MKNEEVMEGRVKLGGGGFAACRLSKGSGV